MMLNDEVMNLPGNDNPVLCADGKLGMLLVYPRNEGLCGVQVHGEEQHRWIAAAELTAGEGGALRQAGSPELPPSTAQHDAVQMMLGVGLGYSWWLLTYERTQRDAVRVLSRRWFHASSVVAFLLVTVASMKPPPMKPLPYVQPTDYVRESRKQAQHRVERASRRVQSRYWVKAWLAFLLGLTLGCTIMAMVRGIT